MRQATTIVLALAALVTASRGDEPVLALRKAVELPALADETLVAIPLDADVYAATQDDLDDIRVLDAERQPVPFLKRKLQTTKSRIDRTTWTARNPSVRPLENGGLEITIALDKDDPRPTGLRLISPLANFEQRIRVESSADGSNWEPTGAEALIFDYSRYLDVRNDGVQFPESGRRHFRITIDDVTTEQESQLIEMTRRLKGQDETGRTERFSVDRRPFRIERIEFFRDVERPQSTGDERSDYPVASFTVEESTKDKQTLVVVKTKREPLTAFTLQTPSRNFSRRVQVQAEHAVGVSRQWRTVGEGTLSRIDFGAQHCEEIKVSFPETRHDTYRMVIDNRDSPPLNIDGVTAEGNVYELVIFAAPASEYSVAYGDEKATAPDYDVSALQSLLESGVQPLPARLGAEQTNSGGPPRPTHWADLVNSPALLIGLVVVLVIALGWGLYRAVKRVDSLPKDGGV